jgi:exopolysaccharide biosynthesis WecB/TagA/CpsF family protein
MISIITVVKNGMPYIADALRSFESQNFLNKELIVVYSKSTDRTLEFLNHNKHRIDKLIIDDTGKNKFDSINLGIKHSSGQILGLLHADDFFYNHDILSIVNNCFQKKSIDLLYGDCLFVDRFNILKVLRYWKSESFTLNKILKGWMPPHTTLFVKKKIYESYDVNFKYSSDFDFIISIFKKNYRFFYLNKIIVIMRSGGDSTKFLMKKIFEDYQIFKKHKLNLFFFLIKYLSKIKQFISKKKNFKKNLIIKDRLKKFSFFNRIEQLNKKIRDRNIIVCAFNFTFFSYLIKKIARKDDILLWCDGFWANFFLSYTSQKNIPGRAIFTIENIKKIKTKSKYIYFIGSTDQLLKRKLISNKIKYKFVNIKKNLTADQIIYCIKNLTFIKNSLAILSFSSPKQEFVGEYLYYEKKISVVCAGAAINMNLGKEKVAPFFFQFLKLEFVWRLQNNSLFRLKRLFTSVINYFKYQF